MDSWFLKSPLVNLSRVRAGLAVILGRDAGFPDEDLPQQNELETHHVLARVLALGHPPICGDARAHLPITQLKQTN